MSENTPALKFFEYEYFDQETSNVKKSTVSAESEQDAKIKLKSTGVEFLSLVAVKPKQKSLFDFKPSLRPIELISILSVIRTMDQAGLDIVKSIEVLKNDLSPNAKVKKICENIHAQLVSGASLSEALGSSSKSFTNDITSVIKIAENTGSYANVMTELIVFTEWSSDINARSKKAVRGPIFSIATIFVMLMLQSIYTVPKMVGFLAQFTQTMPASTRYLIEFTGFIRENAVVIAGLVPFSYITIKILGFLLKPLGIFFDYCKLRIPYIGRVLMNINVARFISFFMLMYNSGADIIEIVEKVGQSMSNKYLKKRMGVVLARLGTGDNFGSCMSDETIFPPMFRKMFRVGELTSDFNGVLKSLKTFYEDETKNSVEGLIAGIKPIMMAILATMIMWMASALLSPIYSNLGKLSGG